MTTTHARAILALTVFAATTSAMLPATAATTIATQAANQLAKGYSAPSRATSLGQVSRLRVAKQASMTGYSRDLFPHWRDASAWGWPVAPSNACDARNAALYRDGVHVTINANCTVTSGSWLDPYTAVRYTSKSVMDVDHLVPLGLAWRGGAATWTKTQRTRFANDPLVLVSVKDTVNQAKGDKGVDLWKPPNKAAWCLYAKRYTSIKTKYALTVTATEKSTLSSMVGGCTR